MAFAVANIFHLQSSFGVPLVFTSNLSPVTWGGSLTFIRDEI